ncbi:PfkB family carbohydrate kinase [Nocardia sp. CDC159]|uniref:PfkB family carbohydrate kinase n=1 Tax=Nocardia pulmonis TaxID=2951408 RepID=A0A9X2E360_9NOCA|nr:MULTISPECIES: PfkB family carbohydrate kinase [Nocardia]MCM6772791.1 PfkB family carbohydrate kinase [Nocardia pulmonis]MCM6785906.1 PfkB family carbohydrate kinase [Nocardia sp. CDC159]
MATAVFVGLATLDIAYALDRYPDEDTKTRARDQFLGAGGPAANAAVTHAFLSGRTPALVTALGEHHLAQVIRRDLDEYGVAPVDVTPSGTHRPPVSSIMVATGSGTRTIVSLDGSEIAAPFDPSQLGPLNDARILLIDGHYPELAVGFATAARASGIPVVLDAGRWREVHAELLALTDIAICSASFAPPGVGADDLFDYLHDHGVGHAAVTHGGRPIPYSAPDGRGEIAVSGAPVVDTLGAGDVLHGAFCHYHVAGQPFPDALRLASEVASASCRYLGTRAWMRHHR